MPELKCAVLRKAFETEGLQARARSAALGGNRKRNRREGMPVFGKP